MRGHTKEQLEARGARLESYVYCENCGLYWAASVFKKHLRTPPPEGITILSPACERLLEFMAETYVDMLVKEHTTTLPDGTKVLPNFVMSPEWEAIAKQPKTAFTVDEAVREFGLSREELLAELERSRVPFEIEIPSASAERRRTPNRAKKK